MTEEREDDREIIVLDIMEKLDIANFLEDNALLVILIGAGLVVVLAGGVVLSILMKKKK